VTQQTPEQPGTWQARVFLAYASEDRKVAVAVQDAITEDAKGDGGGEITVVKWVVNAEFTDSIFANIHSTMSATDFGVFLYSPVDVKARDNVVFESGLYIGMKKADHAIILLPENYVVEPSDLHGILGLKYPYDKLRDDAKDHRTRVNMLDGLGVTIADRIRAIMAKPSPREDQPDTGQPQSGARTEQPPTAAETYSRGLTSLAALGALTGVGEDVSPGRIVVHATYGIGRVMGFDPEGAKTRYVDVQFESGIGRCKLTELFVAPTGLSPG
jgi:hypothetical protein